jgi:PKD repeat protein
MLFGTSSFLTRQTIALSMTNFVADPSFEKTQSSPWFGTSTYGGGTVTVNDATNTHSGSYAALLNAVNTTLKCPGSPECKDSVRATVEQYVQFSQPPPLSNLAQTSDSFSAWWYVANPSATGMPTYSLHIGLVFSDGTSIEYYYGISDLTNQRYNLGPIPATGSWFQMRRNLLSDIQGVVMNPSSTKITTLWFGAFGGTYQNVTHGEKAWVDDVALNFNSGPVAIFSSSPTSGSAPLAVRFDATHSYEIPGASTTGLVASYTWNFGDGSSNVTVTSPVTSHTYGGTGTFLVTLIVTDSNGVKSNPLTSNVVVDPSDVTVPLAVAGGGGLLLVGGLFFTKFRRRPSRVKKPKERFRKG